MFDFRVKNLSEANLLDITFDVSNESGNSESNALRLLAVEGEEKFEIRYVPTHESSSSFVVKVAATSVPGIEFNGEFLLDVVVKPKGQPPSNVVVETNISFGDDSIVSASGLDAGSVASPKIDLPAGPSTVEDVKDSKSTNTGAIRKAVWKPLSFRMPLPGRESIDLRAITCPAKSFLFRDSPVTFEAGFWMSSCPITRAEFSAVLGEEAEPILARFEQNTCHTHPNTPVTRVKWSEVNRFCEMLNVMAYSKAILSKLPNGLVFRLPTEAEWQYASCGGNPKGFADNFREGDAWTAENSGKQIAQVGRVSERRREPNPFGLYDTHGLVMELCVDDHEEDFHETVDPVSLSPGSDSRKRVLKGGSYFHPLDSANSSKRFSLSIDGNENHNGYRSFIGFRIVLGKEILSH